MTDSLPARVARLENSVRVIAACFGMSDVEKAVCSPVREATLREAADAVRARAEMLEPWIVSNTSTWRAGAEVAIAAIEALLAAPAPQPPEPVKALPGGLVQHDLRYDVSDAFDAWWATVHMTPYSRLDDTWRMCFEAGYEAASSKPQPADGLVEQMAEALRELYETHTREPQHNFDFDQLNSFYGRKRRAVMMASDALIAYEQERERAKEGGEHG